jgi:hypothetical protein
MSSNLFAGKAFVLVLSRLIDDIAPKRTRLDLAQALGVSPSSISNVKRGYWVVPVSTFVDMMMLLEVDPKHFDRLLMMAAFAYEHTAAWGGIKTIINGMPAGTFPSIERQQKDVLNTIKNIERGNREAFDDLVQSIKAPEEIQKVSHH